MRFLPILPVIIAVACANLNLNSMYTSCSSDPKASCFGTGSSDCIARKSCDNLVTYRRNDTQLEFFMAGRMSSMKNTYMSIGFSEDAYMGSEAVVGCTLFRTLRKLTTLAADSAVQNLYLYLIKDLDSLCCLVQREMSTE